MIIDKAIELARIEEEEFRNFWPEEGFFVRYMQYVKSQDSPIAFHFWTAATIISGVMQRRIWVSKGIYNVYPNLYTVLVAPSGRCRKSRAISLGLKLIKDFDFVNLIADKTTPEALLEALQFGKDREENPDKKQRIDNTGFIKAPELAVFLNNQTYMAGMIALLTDLYDCGDRFEYRTRTKKTIRLHNIALQFIAGSTPDWLAQCIPESAFGGGFMSRIIFVVRKVRARTEPIPANPPQGIVNELKQLLESMRSLVKGQIVLTPQAAQWFYDWCIYTANAPISDPNLSGFVERKPDTLLKLSMILAVAKLQKVIDLDTMKRALRIINWTQDRAFAAFKQVDLSPMGKLRYKILEMLEVNNGAMKRRDILRNVAGRLSRGIQDMMTLEQLMVDAEDIKVENRRKNGNPGPDCVWYVKIHHD